MLRKLDRISRVVERRLRILARPRIAVLYTLLQLAILGHALQNASSRFQNEIVLFRPKAISLDCLLRGKIEFAIVVIQEPAMQMYRTRSAVRSEEHTSEL